MWRARLFSEVPSDRTRGNVYKLKHSSSPLNIRKKSFHCEHHQALAQVAHTSCGVSILGDLPKPPGQCAPGAPTWAGWLGQMTSRGAFQPQSSCDSSAVSINYISLGFTFTPLQNSWLSAIALIFQSKDCFNTSILQTLPSFELFSLNYYLM